MRRYAVARDGRRRPIWDQLVRTVAQEFEHDGLLPWRAWMRPTSSSTCSTLRARGVSAEGARDLFGGVLRARRRASTTCSRRATPCWFGRFRTWSLPCPRQGDVVHDDGAGDVQGLGGSEGHLCAAGAAREVEARDRQRVPPGSRARAVGRGRDPRARLARRASGWTTSTCCPRRSRCTSSCPSGISAT